MPDCGTTHPLHSSRCTGFEKRAVPSKRGGYLVCRSKYASTLVGTVGEMFGPDAFNKPGALYGLVTPPRPLLEGRAIRHGQFFLHPTQPATKLVMISARGRQYAINLLVGKWCV